jgi:membrane protease YdiL (CAAX protease family)
MKSFWKLFTGILSRVLYTFTWLIVLSICIEELDVFPAIVTGFIIIAVFLLIHVKFLLPKKWDFGRTKFVIPERIYFLILTALILVLGDIFWIYHVKTSQSGFEEDSLPFVIFGIIAYPLIEEFGFRLWLQSFLESKFNKIISIGIVALIFALFHKPEMPIPQLLSGVLYGVVLVTTKSIWIPVLLHLMHNALLILSGKIEYVKEISFEMMDRQDNLNLTIAITLWVLSTLFVFQWIRWNKRKLITTHNNGHKT